MVRTSTNGMAIASLVLSLVWCFGIGSVLAIVFGYKAKREIDWSNGMQTGRGMAVAGIVIGWVGAVIAVLYVLIAIIAVAHGTSTSTGSY